MTAGSCRSNAVVKGLTFDRLAHPSVLLLHLSTQQSKQITHAAALPADRVLVMLWSTNRTFEGWLASRGSRDLEASAPFIAVDPVVARGIAAVASSSNPSEGITHGYGRSYAIDALRKLQHAGYEVNGAGLEAAGFTAKLRWDDVVELRTYADQLVAGHQYRIGPDSYRADVVELWTKQVTASPAD